MFVPGCSRPLFGRRAVTSHSSGRRSLPRPLRPFARSLPPTIPPPVPLSVWPRSAAFTSYPASASTLACGRVRACPVWWQALAPRSRGHLYITCSKRPTVAGSNVFLGSNLGCRSGAHAVAVSVYFLCASHRTATACDCGRVGFSIGCNVAAIGYGAPFRAPVR